jgi:hypothetical protein
MTAQAADFFATDGSSSAALASHVTDLTLLPLNAAHRLTRILLLEPIASALTHRSYGGARREPVN